jgi:methyl-accepting chemotaxis protein
MINGVNQIVEEFDKLVDDTTNALSIMATGDLTPRITGEYKGKFELMKNDINNLGGSLSNLVSEIKNSVGATVDSSQKIEIGRAHV